MDPIKTIVLSNGAEYSIFDTGAIRLNEQGILVTGNDIVDSAILQGDLYIVSIDNVPIGNNITNVLVQDETTHRIMKRSIDQLLEDAGGASYSIDGTTLELKIGK